MLCLSRAAKPGLDRIGERAAGLRLRLRLRLRLLCPVAKNARSPALHEPPLHGPLVLLTALLPQGEKNRGKAEPEEGHC